MLNKCLKIVLAARIILDLAASLDVEFTDSQLQRITEEISRNPWNAGKHKILKRMILVNDLLTTRNDTVDPETRDHYFKQCLKRQPSLFMPELMRDTSNSKQPEHSDSQQEEPKKALREAVGATTRNTTIDEIHNVMCQYNKSSERWLARELYKMIKQEKLSYAELITGLQSRYSPEDILQNATIESLKKHQSKAPKREANKPITVESEPTNFIQADEYKSVNLVFSKKFKQWIRDLKDVRAIEKIRARFKRAREGNFGDHKIVRGGAIELRVDGYRVYLRKVKNTPNKFKVILGGNKSSQEQDINTIQTLK